MKNEMCRSSRHPSFDMCCVHQIVRKDVTEGFSNSFCVMRLSSCMIRDNGRALEFERELAFL